MKAVLFVFSLLILGQSTLLRGEPSPVSYFAEIYGYRNRLNTAAFSHTFASFYKVDAEYNVTRLDISWIPQDAYMPGLLRDLRMPAFGDFPGQNLSLENTIARATNAKRTISRFGPFASTEELYRRAENQVRNLNSGAVTYRGLDMATRPYSVNCIHAVTSPVGEFYSGLRRGPVASAAVAEFFFQRGMLKNRTVEMQWLPVLQGAYRNSREFKVIH